ncbi:MAG: hypothetical protein IJ297_06415 [Clostridia bacterium]|nr:hypothetical protein [Clostridia bacterium]
MPLVQKPYLPEKRVRVAIGDVKIKNVEIIKPYPIQTVVQSMSLHADLSICYLGRGIAICAPEAFEYYKEKLSCYNISLIRGETIVCRNYPCDAAYNVAIVGNKIFCKEKITDNTLKSCAIQMGYEIININQGYAKCSVCPIDEKTAISADMSFVKKASEAGIEVLPITNEGIQLKGFSEGFFGGCAFMTDKHTFSLKGDIDTLPSVEKIRAFLLQKGISIENQTGQVQDFGSLVPIIEE